MLLTIFYCDGIFGCYIHNILFQVKEQPHERDLHNTMDTVLIFDTMTGLRTEAEKSTTINISQSTFMSRKRTNMFGIHNILQTIQKYTLLSSKADMIELQSKEQEQEPKGQYKSC
jgi:hypothetical protein